jgi:hypothetical protein
MEDWWPPAGTMALNHEGEKFSKSADLSFLPIATIICFYSPSWFFVEKWE